MQTQKQRLALLGKILTVTVACLLIASSMLFGASAAVAFPEASTPTAVYLDGKEVLPGECIILASVTYVPLRNFCNLFEDCKITWNGKTSTATVKTDDLTLTAQSGAIYITANGHYYYTVGEVRNLNGHLYVPIRPLAKAFAAELRWNASARRVELTSDPSGRNAVRMANYDADEVYWLSRIISAEAKGEPMKGQIAVGNVVLNRVRSPSYPNTIYGVIFDRKHGTQFSPVSFGTIYQKPTASAEIAAKICLEGYSLSEDILFFLNPRASTNFWIVKNRPFAFTIGNHDFYK
jgi:N-acetylmuramoyl-L-alanine amidase